MSAEDDRKSAGSGVVPPAITVVGELIKTAAHNPSVRAAGGELGKAAHTIAKTINIALLPLAAINFGYERAKHYFDENFRPDLEAKLAGLSAEEIVEPKASLAGPVLQGLAFTHEEAALKDMYLNLLASAMKRGEATRAHPAFAEVIKQLTAEEARILLAALSPPNIKPIAQIRAMHPNGGWTVLLNHVMPITDSGTNQPVEEPDLPAMVDNWIRLGLVDISYVEHLASQPGSNRYEWAQKRPEFERLKSAHATGPVVAAPGRFSMTAFGSQFAQVVDAQGMFVTALAAPKAQ